MEAQKIYGQINDICIIGYGSIAKGTLPLIRRHFQYNRITIIDPHPVEAPQESENVKFMQIGLTADNFKEILDKIFVGKVGFCVNLSIGVSSSDVTQYCQAKGIFYIDTAKCGWTGYHQQGTVEQKSNYNIRQKLLRDVRKHGLKTTAVSTCGANPGMVSWFVKQALLNIAKDVGFPLEGVPKNKSEWAHLMMDLGVKGIHIAERDTQRSNEFRPPKQIWNTWSVEGLMIEGFHMPSELGWGTHEKWVPKEAVFHREGCQSAIYMTKPGMNVTVKSWCPTYGPQVGFLITHDEAISIADFFTVRENGEVKFRPTCHYAYHPCPDALTSSFEAIGSGSELEKQRILEKEIVTGMDELGVLLYGHAKNAYWYGSQLTIEDTRKRAPNQNATALQVTSAVLAGMVWTLENPQAGLVDADEMDYKRCLQIQEEYISPVRGYYTDWNPLKNRRNELVNDGFDLEDPWQFKNVLVHK